MADIKVTLAIPEDDLRNVEDLHRLVTSLGAKVVQDARQQLEARDTSNGGNQESEGGPAK